MPVRVIVAEAQPYGRCSLGGDAKRTVSTDLHLRRKTKRQFDKAGPTDSTEILVRSK